MPTPSILEVFLLFLSFWFVVVPLVGLTHELGHAICGLLWTDARVQVRLVGANEQTRSIALGRLSVSYRPQAGGSQVVLNRQALTPWQQAVTAACGPLASLVGALAFGFLAVLVWDSSAIGFWFFALVAVWNAKSFLLELLPKTRGPLWSDGKVICDVIRGGPGRPRSRGPSR